MELALIAAVAENGVIGNNGDIPWYLPQDMKLFKEITIGNTVVMGRRTWESLPSKYRPLPNRNNVVVSTTLGHLDEADVCSSYESAIEKAQSYNRDIFIMGGASLYERALKDANRMFISYVYQEPEGDTYFPNFDREKWNLIKRKSYSGFELHELERKMD